MNYQEWLLGFISAALIALVSYLLGLRVTRKQRLHQSYGDILPLVNDTIVLVKTAKAVRQVKLSAPERFWSCYYKVCEGLMAISDIQTIRRIADKLTADPKMLSRSKISDTFILIQYEALGSLNAEILRNARLMRRSIESLKLLGPSVDVGRYLDEFDKMILRQLLESDSEVLSNLSKIDGLDIEEIKGNLRELEMQLDNRLGIDFEELLNGLADAMRRDLNHKF